MALAMKTRTADRIREDLENRIIQGDFKKGDRLDEVRLATSYGVSRTPMREALQMLSASGLVELIPRRGAFVRHPGIVELLEMFELMAELEAMCGRLAARRVSSGELAELSMAAKACERALEKEEPDAYYHQNELFHALIYRLSGNSFLADETNKLNKRLRPFRRIQLRAKGRMEQSMAEHVKIVEALEKGDSALTGSVLHDHVSVQGEKFRVLISTYEDQGKDKNI